MRRRLPLSAKILLWFFLNLLILLAAGWLVVDAQVRSGLNSFLAGYVGQRVEAAARQLVDALAAAPESEWNDIVERHARAHGVQFMVLAGAEHLAGPRLDLPEIVRQRVPRGGPEPGRMVPPAGRKGPPHFPRPEGELPPDPTDAPPEPQRSLIPRPLPIHERFLIRSDTPRAYWTGLLMAMRHGDPPGPPIPVTLLMRADTFAAGGFFFDYRPWLLGAGGLVLLSVLVWLPLIRSVTRTIVRMSAATGQIADGRFDVSVDAKRGDELGQLGASINRMAGRLQGFVKGQKRFLGDMAHELCSPLARLQMGLGILEQRVDEKQKPYLDDVREEVQHMSDLVNELLSFSKASLKPADIKRQPVNVRELTVQAGRRETAGRAELENHVPTDLFVLAHPDLLQRALSNLVRNALRYAADGGPITLSARRANGRVRISVADRGPGIPEEHLPQVFDTFYRIESSRDRESGGVGLGLSIVRNCVETCGGTVRARNRRSGGLRVTIELEAAAASAAAGTSVKATKLRGQV